MIMPDNNGAAGGIERIRHIVVVGAGAMGSQITLPLPLPLPLPVRLVFVAAVGLGTTGTSLLIYGLVANQFPTKMRGAAVAWAAGFGRLGGVSGPLLGGFDLAAGLSVDNISYILTGLAVVGVILTLLVPRLTARTTSIPHPSNQPQRSSAAHPPAPRPHSTGPKTNRA
jgi:MFS transporter, AAHS family, benzoate transport protein